MTCVNIIARCTFFSNRLYSKFKQFVVKSNPISFKGAVFFLCVICPSNSNRILRLAMQCVFSSLSFSFVVYGGPLILTRSFKMTNYSCFHDSTKKAVRQHLVKDTQKQDWTSFWIWNYTIKLFLRLKWLLCGYLFKYVFSRNLIFL